MLRLTEADRFELAAADSLGRSLGTLTVDERRGVWRAARGRPACRFDPQRPFAIDRLDWELPARDLASALVGRLPEAPAAADPAAPAVEFLDREGRRWTAVRDARGPLRWTLWRGEEPALRWERTERGGLLSAAQPALEVRWRESAREPLGAASRRLTAAEVEGLAECDGAAVS